MGPSYRVVCNGENVPFSDFYDAVAFDNMAIDCGMNSSLQVNRHDDKGWVDYV